MSLVLLRHAVAFRRGGWSGDDLVRPLTARGELQADGLVAVLVDHDPVRILSSPAVRCVDTVQPLAAKLARPVEMLDELLEGQGAAAVAYLMAALADAAGGTVVACTHGDVLDALLHALAPAASADVASLKKAGHWVVTGIGRKSPKVVAVMPPV